MTRVYRCDRRFLAARLMIHLLLATLIGVLSGMAFVGLGVAVGVLLFVIAVCRWAVYRSYRFTVGHDTLRTEMLFTEHIDVTTPISQIQGVSAYEGVIEALFDVGTVEISTASSNAKHSTLCWPYLSKHRAIAENLRHNAAATRR